MFSLRQLTNRIFTRVRLHPILVLPVLVADLVGFVAMHLQHALHQPLFEVFLNRNRSVLGTTHTAFVLTPQNAAQAALLTAPLLWGCYFLNILLYTSALVAVAKLLDEHGGVVPDFSDVKHLLWNSKGRLFGFSALTFMSLVVQLPLTYGLFLLATKMPSFMAMNSRDIGYAVAFIVETTAVLLLTRPVLKLLGRPQAEHEAVQLARALGLMVLLAQFAILAIIDSLLPASFFEQRTVVGFLVREAFTSILAALPYVPFFVGLATIAQSPQDQL